MTTTTQNQTMPTEAPCMFIPSFHQALELAAVHIEKTHGNAAHERFWETAGDPAGREEMRSDYAAAASEHIADWGDNGNRPVAQRLAETYAEKHPDTAPEIPANWSWPVCDDCLTSAYDAGITGCVEQARFMEQIGAEMPDHLCEMSLDPEDRGRQDCSCGCRRPAP